MSKDIDDVILAMQQGFKEVVSQLIEEPPSGGEGMIMSFTPEFQEQYAISPLGRLMIKERKITLHAGPNERSKTYVKYQRDVRNFINFADDYADGNEPAVPISKMMTRPQAPVPEDSLWKPITDLENKLFLHLSSTEQEFCLLNPSWGSYARARCYVISVCFTYEYDQVESIREDLRKTARERVREVDRSRLKDMVTYLGSNRPEQIPTYVTRYVCIIPDPYQLDKLFVDYGVEKRAGLRLLKYIKIAKRGKNLQQYSYLYDSPPGAILYPPPTLSHWMKDSSPFFIESNFMELGSYRGADHVMPHTPSFLDGRPPWTVLFGQSVRMKGNQIYDVDIYGRDVGSYLSRRSWVPPDGYEWAPLLDKGTVPVTVYTVKLREDPSYKVHILPSLGGADVLTLSFSEYPVETIIDVARAGVLEEPKKTWRTPEEIAEKEQRIKEDKLVLNVFEKPLDLLTPIRTPSGYGYIGWRSVFKDLKERREYKRWFTSRDHNIAWTGDDLVVSGFFFRRDSLGTRLDASSPKGFRHTVLGFTVGLTSYFPIMHNTMVSDYLFPSVRDFGKYYTMTPASMNKWTMGDYFRPIDIDVKYQCKDPVTSQVRIAQALNDVDFKDWGDKGRSLGEILQRCTDAESINVALVVLSNCADFICVSSAKGFTGSSWVLKSKMDITFPHDNTSLGGKTLLWAIRSCDEKQKVVFTIDPHSKLHGNFIRLMSNNCYRVFVNLRVHPAKLTVRRVR